MPVSAARLRDDLRDRLRALAVANPRGAGDTAIYEEIAEAILNEITANAAVTVTVTSVTGVTVGAGVSGPGTGTGTIA